MNVTIEQSWKNELADVWNKDYFINLTNFVKAEYRTKQIFPPGRDIFAAFNTTPFNDVKVVILGQDPYHDVGQANGLCFSVSDGIPFPPSLSNIFKEVHDDTGVPSTVGRPHSLGQTRRVAAQLHTHRGGAPCRLTPKPRLGAVF